MKGIHLTLVLGLAACASPGEGASEADSKQAAHLNAQPWERDPYTRTSEILIDRAVVGYLVEYRPIPVGMQVERALPTGSYRIEGRRFELIGVVSPSGEVRRISANGSEPLGAFRLEEGLKRFFGSSARVELHELQPAPPRKPAPKEEGEKGDAGKEGEEGGEKAPEPSGGK